MFSREERECILPEVNNFFQENIDGALTNIEISEEDIKSKLTKVKPGKAPAIDGLVPKFLIETADVICKTLALIFKILWSLARCQRTGRRPVLQQSLNRIVLAFTDL